MITINDPYNLVPGLFDVYTKISKSGTSAEVDVFLTTSDEALIPSNKLSILIDPEPNMHHWDKLYNPLTNCRPNSLITVSGYPLDNKRYIPYWINTVVTIKNNPTIPALDLNAEKPFDAAMLLGAWSIQRGTMIDRLKQLDLIEKCIVNYFDGAPVDDTTRQHRVSTQPQYFFNYRSKVLDEYDLPVFKSIAFDGNRMNTCRAIPNLPPGNPSWVSQLIAEQIYQNSYISVVAETWTGEGVFFMSEKITKPLLIGHPFVIFGCTGFLKELKNLGFKTFDCWINEDYDLIHNDVERASKVIDSLAEFISKPLNEKNQILNEMKPVLEHNKQLITNPQWLYSDIVDWVDSLS